MNVKYIAILGFAAIIVAFFFMVFTGEKEDAVPELTNLQAPETANTGETITFVVGAMDSVELTKIIFKTTKEEIEQKCNTVDCTATFTKIFITPGTYEIEFIAQNSIGKEASQKIFVRIFDTGESCIDKTPVGECSKEKPFFCTDKKLVEDCTECGCPEGTDCILGNCQALSGKLEIISAKALPAPIVREQTGFKVKISLINSENAVVAKGAQYILKAKLTGTEIIELEKNIELNKRLEQNEITEIEFNFNGVQNGMYSLELELSSIEEMIDTFTRENFLDSSNDLTPPSKPTGLSAIFKGETLEINWNPNKESDLEGYILFKSNDSQPTHITYSQFMEFNNKTTNAEILGLSEGTHYFVLKAIDFLKNESEFSLNTKAEKR